MRNKAITSLITITILASLIMGVVGCNASASAPLPPEERLRVATTTSLYDTGLWGYLEPMFEKKSGVELDIIYAGTGIALEYGRRGDVDVITVKSSLWLKVTVWNESPLPITTSLSWVQKTTRLVLKG